MSKISMASARRKLTTSAASYCSPGAWRRTVSASSRSAMRAAATASWDAHDDMKSHEPLCRAVDKPISGLIRDLKQRGMLDSTLVVFTSEFGRTPWSQNTTGRDHNAMGFTSWLSGGGVKGGVVEGATDEVGYRGGREAALHQRSSVDDPAPGGPELQEDGFRRQRPAIPPCRRRRRPHPSDPGLTVRRGAGCYPGCYPARRLVYRRGGSAAFSSDG